MGWELVNKDPFSTHRGRHKRTTPAIRKSVSTHRGKETTTIICLMPKSMIGDSTKSVIIYEDQDNKRLGFKPMHSKVDSGYSIRQVKSNSDLVEFNIPKKFSNAFEKGTTDVTVLRESKSGLFVLEY